MSTGEKTVCVTGASGYIASWLVKLLLRRGYTVKATVRDLDDPKRTQHLLTLDGANERLQLIKADLLQEGSFDSAVDGCIGVFHTASPVSLFPVDPQVELIDPAVEGTLNVLRSCAKAPSVRRVVVTSSIASVVYTEKPIGSDDVVDETWFSDASFCERSKLWYVLSKTLAEAASWKFAKETGTDLVTIHPNLVIGPLLQPNFSLSTGVILDLATGKMPLLHRKYRFVDVRDVASAHIQAFEIPPASGRYILDGTDITSDEMFKIFQEFNPDLKVTEISEDDGVTRLNYNVSMEKAKSLGIDFIPAETSLRDTIQSLKEKGFF